MRLHGIDTAVNQEVQTVISDQAIRVLRNTYLLLAITLIPTIIGAFLGVNFDWVGFITNNAFLFENPLLAFGIQIAIFAGFYLAIRLTAKSVVGIFFLLGFTFYLGFLLGPLLLVALDVGNGPSLIAYAVGTTALIFFGMATYVTTTKKDFSKFGKFLFVGLILAVVASIANLFFAIPALSLAISSAVVLLMSFYILYDVSRILHGGETNYILATCELYLDIYILFTHLLRILIALSGRD